ncbi:hypothetical protein CERSUDRAFT_162708 [Gelatoporia subvermispora B]|uniref:Autophagy-related protein 2 n=1 Tax=Ceriporiopsis subvermispora (strain B) TaxID=914234 RepID=M2QYN3_CERS8|nr:hypothetical protein CERSUDRAFT_162708 [Gelatoporia subvermispora B]
MSWWPPSWLPTLPSIDFSLPSGIQRRFVSFALRRPLGHLLKPGQLEAQQVDSQIGSGYVQVKDLELDNDAINAPIAELPVRLHEGSLGRVTARVPWPNPLTSTIGLSLESLHLVFELSPTLSESVPALAHNLAESVASVAESFVHDELSPTEEATLRHSFYPDMTASSQSLGPELPGGLDPFVGDDESSHGEGEMPEVSIFATLVQRLLARFEFEATDIRITLVHPEHASFTLKISEIRYDFPTNKSSSPRGNTGTGPEDSERCITISGVTLTTRSLLPLSPQVMTLIQASSLVSEKSMSPATSHAADPVSPGASISPSSPRSDSSELDEDTQMLMSQSLAFLPPRPVSPASEAASSMYQSAISSPVARFAQPEALEPEAGTSRTPSPPSDTQSTSPSAPTPTPPPPQCIVTDVTEDEEDTIFSLTSEPVIIRFMLPSSASRNVEEPPHPPPSDAQHQEYLEDNTNRSPAQPLVLNISLGVPACALRHGTFVV